MSTLAPLRSQFLLIWGIRTIAARKMAILERMVDSMNDTAVVVRDIKMPFWSMVVFMVKAAIASDSRDSHSNLGRGHHHRHTNRGFWQHKSPVSVALPGQYAIGYLWGFSMSLLNGLLGNASTVDAADASKEYAQLLGTGEQLEHAYKLIRDAVLFTNRRLILVDKQGLTGKKIEYVSIPYKSVVRFSVETAGHFDLDAELKIWTSGMTTPIQKQFGKAVSIYEVQALLAEYVGR